MKKSILFISLVLGFQVASAKVISGEVVLSKSVEKKVKAALNEKSALYVFARAANSKGKGFPLAVKRIAKPTFPLTFKLSQKDSMVEGTVFSGPVQITARLSPTGDVMAKKDSFEGIAGADGNIVVGQKAKVKVTITE